MRLAKPAMAAVLMVLGALVASWESGLVGGDRSAGSASGPSVETLFEAQRSDVWLELEGRVDRVLSDDNIGSRHQRFIVRMPSGHTVLVAHNIDLAPRVADISPETTVRLYGEYEWNERGGVVHWTHHDPDGDIPGGWIEYRGQRYY
ncbi:MAG: DUF3465 domain-containing protein [Pseudomonadota bacterium]